jgi:hypothetical protein
MISKMASSCRLKTSVVLKQTAYLIYYCTDDPCNDGCIDSGEGSPPPGACLMLDGDNGGDAGEIEQHEEKIAIGYQRGQLFQSSQHSNSGGNDLLGSYTCDERDIQLPVETLK